MKEPKAKRSRKRKTEPESEDLKFKNKPEELAPFSANREFFEGLKKITDKFHKEIRAYGDQFRIEINTSVHYELVNR